MMKTPDWHQSMYDSDFADRTINSQDFLELAETEVNGLVQLLNLESGVKILDVPCGERREIGV